MTQVRLRLLLPATLFLVVLPGCVNEAEQRAQRPPSAVPALETITVERRPVVRERVWDGVVEAVDKVLLSAQTPGRLQELPVDIGDRVEAGQVVARLTDVEQRAGQRQAEANLRSAQAVLAEAERNFERVAALVRDGFLSQAAYDQALASRDTAQANLAAAQAALREGSEQVAYTLVRSPYAGVVTARLAEPGEAVGIGQPLLALLAEEQLRVAVDVPQSELAALRARGRAAVLLPGGERMQAERLVIFPQADALTHSVRVRVMLPRGAGGLQPGAVAKVAFELERVERVLLPLSALRQRGEVSAVYVVGEDGRVSLRQLRLGHRHGDQVEVLAGLRDGERVAADPLAALAWLTSQRQEGGHG